MRRANESFAFSACPPRLHGFCAVRRATAAAVRLARGRTRARVCTSPPPPPWARALLMTLSYTTRPLLAPSRPARDRPPSCPSLRSRRLDSESNRRSGARTDPTTRPSKHLGVLATVYCTRPIIIIIIYLLLLPLFIVVIIITSIMYYWWWSRVHDE